MGTEVKYPVRGDLRAALEVATHIRNAGGSLSLDELAARLGYSGKENGTFLARIGSAKLFGLVEGRGMIRPTRLATQIIAPESNEQKARALLRAFEAVPLYKAFLDEFHGQPLGDLDGAASIVNRWGVREAEAGRVFNKLMDSAKLAGLFSTKEDRMIRPTRFAAPTVLDEKIAPATLRAPQSTPAPVQSATQDSARWHKLIEGAFELLPPVDEGWTEDDIEQFVKLLRVNLMAIYKVSPSARGGEMSSANGHSAELVRQ